MTPQEWATKEKIDKLDFVNIKNFCISKTLSKKWIYKLQHGRKYLQTMYLIGDSYPEYTKNTYNSTTKRQTTWFKNGQKRNSRVSKKYIEMASKHMKRYQTSLVLGEMQIKATMRYHFTLGRMTKENQHTKNSKYWWVWRNQDPCALPGNI